MSPCPTNHHLRSRRSRPLTCALNLAVGLTLAVPASSALAAGVAAGVEPSAAASAAPERAALGRQPLRTPDLDAVRRQVRQTVSLDELLVAQSRVEADELPVTLRCDQIPPLTTDGAAAPRRFTRPSIIDARALCWGICMLGCLADGAPFDVCNDVCTDECYRGGAALTAARAEDPARFEAELEPLVALGAEILSPSDLASAAPRRHNRGTAIDFECSNDGCKCNKAACVCKGVRGCLELIDSGKCADFYCSMGPECVCNRQPGT